jgi:hypothetical protein
MKTSDKPPGLFRLQDKSDDRHIPKDIRSWLVSDATQVTPPIRVGEWVNYRASQGAADAERVTVGLRGKVVAIQGEVASVRWSDSVNGLHRPLSVLLDNLMRVRA